VMELAAKYAEVGAHVQSLVAAQFEQYGLSITQLVIENVSLPPEVEATLDQRTRMNMLGDLDRYAKLQSADAIRDAARNTGGGAAAGIAVGLGAALSQHVTNVANVASAPAAPAPSAFEPPPIPVATWYYVENGERRGPVDLATLTRSAAVNGTTLVWKAGMANWTAAAEVAELKPLLDGR